MAVRWYIIFENASNLEIGRNTDYFKDEIQYRSHNVELEPVSLEQRDPRPNSKSCTITTFFTTFYYNLLSSQHAKCYECCQVNSKQCGFLRIFGDLSSLDDLGPPVQGSGDRFGIPKPPPRQGVPHGQTERGYSTRCHMLGRECPDSVLPDKARCTYRLSVKPQRVCTPVWRGQ